MTTENSKLSHPLPPHTADTLLTHTAIIKPGPLLMWKSCLFSIMVYLQKSRFCHHVELLTVTFGEGVVSLPLE